MKRSFEPGEDNRDGKDNGKKRISEPDKGEAIKFDQTNQSNETNEVNSDEEIEFRVDEETGRDKGGETTRKKKGRTSWVWKHFNIRLSDDQETEYAHCCYCTRYNLQFPNDVLMIALF